MKNLNQDVPTHLPVEYAPGTMVYCINPALMFNVNTIIRGRIIRIEYHANQLIDYVLETSLHKELVVSEFLIFDRIDKLEEAFDRYCEKVKENIRNIKP